MWRGVARLLAPIGAVDCDRCLTFTRLQERLPPLYPQTSPKNGGGGVVGGVHGGVQEVPSTSK